MYIQQTSRFQPQQLDGLFDFVGDLFGGAAKDAVGKAVAKTAVDTFTKDAVSKIATDAITKAAVDTGKDAALQALKDAAISKASQSIVDVGAKSIVEGGAKSIIDTAVSGSSSLLSKAAPILAAAGLTAALGGKGAAPIAAALEAAGGASVQTSAVDALRGSTSDAVAFGTPGNAFQPDQTGAVYLPTTSPQSVPGMSPGISTIGASAAAPNPLTQTIAGIPMWVLLAGGAGILLFALTSSGGSKKK